MIFRTNCLPPTPVDGAGGGLCICKTSCAHMPPFPPSRPANTTTKKAYEGEEENENSFFRRLDCTINHPNAPPISSFLYVHSRALFRTYTIVYTLSRRSSSKGRTPNEESKRVPKRKLLLAFSLGVRSSLRKGVKRWVPISASHLRPAAAATAFAS